MRRSLLCSAVLAACALPCRAETTVTPTETLIRLKVQAMAAPKPALRYVLLPELKEMTPGNPIPNYLKCLLDQEVGGARENIGKSALRQADRAARMDKPDWQILLKLKTDGIGLLLPDVQKMRALAAGLQERFRAEMIERRLDDALATAKTMFALSRHMGEHPTLIGDLVGIAIAFVTIAPLDELLEQPGCPNLYWALTNLPSPFISLDRGMEGERAMIVGELSDLDERAPMNADQIRKLLKHLDFLRAVAGDGRSPKSLRSWLDAQINDKKLMAAARRRLVEVGYPEDRLKSFPPEQLLLLDEKRDFEVKRDEVMKLMKLPIWQSEELCSKLAPIKESDTVFGNLIPALQKVRRAQGRLEQRIAMLRHIEALRMYAAEHDGKFPEKLSEIAVPLPVDPFSGKPFNYKLEGSAAHLQGTPPPDAKSIAAYNLHYEVTIKK
jgi:hypothetical protein